jgi:hypothetical protein
MEPAKPPEKCSAILYNGNHCDKQIKPNSKYCFVHSDSSLKMDKISESMLNLNLEIICDYVNDRTPCTFKCIKCNCEFINSPYNIYHNKNPVKCPFCSKKNQMPILDRIKNKINEKGHEFIGEEKDKSGHYTIYFKCSCNPAEITKSNSSVILNEKWGGCFRCVNSRGNQKWKFEDVKKEFEDRGLLIYDTSYKNLTTPIKYKCSCGNENAAITLKALLKGSLCNMCKGERRKQTIANNYGENFTNTFQVPSIKDKIKETNLNKFGENHPMKNNEIVEKRDETVNEKYKCEYTFHSENSKEKSQENILNTFNNKCFMSSSSGINYCKNKYNANNVLQAPEIHEKQIKSSFSMKEYKFPSGKIINYQGYENFALDMLLNKNIKEQNIIVEKSFVPRIYYFYDGGEHIYFPDIYIKGENSSENLFIEVKCEYTFKNEINKNIAKFLYTLETIPINIYIFKNNNPSINECKIISNKNELYDYLIYSMSTYLNISINKNIVHRNNKSLIEYYEKFNALDINKIRESKLIILEAKEYVPKKRVRKPVIEKVEVKKVENEVTKIVKKVEVKKVEIKKVENEVAETVGKIENNENNENKPNYNYPSYSIIKKGIELVYKEALETKNADDLYVFSANELKELAAKYKVRISIKKNVEKKLIISHLMEPHLYPILDIFNEKPPIYEYQRKINYMESLGHTNIMWQKPNIIYTCKKCGNERQTEPRWVIIDQWEYCFVCCHEFGNKHGKNNDILKLKKEQKLKKYNKIIELYEKIKNVLTIKKFKYISFDEITSKVNFECERCCKKYSILKKTMLESRWNFVCEC